MKDEVLDIDDLILKCRSRQSKIHIEEASICFRAGAYRAAIVLTWIAVVYDLVDKIREIDLIGDAKARDFLRKFENIQEAISRDDPDALKRSLEFERSILKAARDEFELLSTNEMNDLERLQIDRHRCAHPSMNSTSDPYRPSADLARLHLRNSLFCVLIQPPVQGKAAFERVKRELSSEYFPDNLDEAVTALRGGPLSRPRAVLVAQTIHYSIVEFVNSNNSKLPLSKYLIAVNALVAMHPESARPALQKAINRLIRDSHDSHLGCLLAALCYVDGIWHTLHSSEKSKIKSFIRSSKDLFNLDFLDQIRQIHELAPLVDLRVSKANEDEMKMIVANGAGHLVIDKIVDFYCECKNFGAANYVFETFVKKNFEYLTTIHIEKILRSPRELGSDLRGSFGFEEFKEMIGKRGDLALDSIVDCAHSENIELPFDSQNDLDSLPKD